MTQQDPETVTVARLPGDLVVDRTGAGRYLVRQAGAVVRDFADRGEALVFIHERLAAPGPDLPAAG